MQHISGELSVGQVFLQSGSGDFDRHTCGDHLLKYAWKCLW